MTTNRTDDDRPGPWLALVFKSMSTKELKHEAENPENTDDERRLMRAEVARREVK